MVKLLPDVYFVNGAVNGAIYDLIRQRVYSVNRSAVQIIQRLSSEDRITDSEADYLLMLQKAGLYDQSVKPQLILPDAIPEIPHDEMFDLVWLELTHACNLKCVHCYEGAEHHRTTFRMSFDQWKSVIDQVAELGTKGVVVIGGEPSIHPDASRILRYLKARGLAASFFTNATFGDGELRRAIIDTGTAMRVSLYGHTSEIHDRITQVKGSFDATIENIKRFISCGIAVHVSVIFMRENEHHLHAIENYVKGLGVAGYKFDVIRCVHGGDQAAHLPLTDEVRRLGRIVEPKFRISREKFYNALHFNPCWNRKLVVSEDGAVLPCEFAREIHVGNVNKQSIAEIVKSDELTSCWRLSMDKVTECCRCEFRYACRDCRPYAMAQRNCRTDKTPKCDYDPISGVWKNG